MEDNDHHDLPEPWRPLAEPIEVLLDPVLGLEDLVLAGDGGVLAPALVDLAVAQLADVGGLGRAGLLMNLPGVARITALATPSVLLTGIWG